MNETAGWISAVRWPLAAVSLVQAMTMMAVVTVPVMAPALAADLGVDTSRVGLYPSIAFAGAAMLTVLSGSLVRRHGGVRVNQASLALTAAGLAATLSGSIALIALGALLVGGGYGLATPGASHVLARVAPAECRGLVFSIKQSAVPMGGLLAGLIVPPVVELAGWRAGVATVAAMVGLAAIAIQPLRARLDDDRDPRFPVGVRASWHSVSLVLGAPALRAMVLVAFTFAALQLSLFAFLVTYLVERVGLTLVVAGTVFAVMQAAGMVARIAWGWMSDHVIAARPLLALIGAGAVASALLAAGFSAGWPLAAIMATAAALGATAVGWNGVYLAEIARVVPLQQVGAATGGTLMFTFVGIMVGPSSFGAIVALTDSYAAALAALAAPVLIAVIVLVRKG